MIRMCSLTLTFRLLDIYSARLDPQAPILYKSVVFSLIENPFDSTLREFILTQLTSLFKANPTVPVELVVEPLCRRIQNVSLKLNMNDIGFLKTVTWHPRLTIQAAVCLVQLFSWILLKYDISPYCIFIKQFMIDLLARFKEEVEVENACLQFTHRALEMFDAGLLSIESQRLVYWTLLLM